MNIFGKAFIGKLPGHQATIDEILTWKNSSNVQWAKSNLWNKSDSNNDSQDTYMSRIAKEVLKANEQTANNYAFVIAIVDLIFDTEIQTTTFSGELIVKRMIAKEKERDALQEVI